MRRRSSQFYVQRSPRNRARHDRPLLTLHDAGHGSSPESSNPILFGIGCRIQFDLGVTTRSWRAYVEAPHADTGVTVKEEITDYFTAHPTVERRFVMSGLAGVFPFALSSDDQADFDNARAITFIIETSNVSISREVRGVMVVHDLFDISACEEAEDCDFGVYSILAKAGIRLFDDFVHREAAGNEPVSFYFQQMDTLLGHAPDLVAQLGSYSETSTVGIEFGNDGRCGHQPAGATPHCDVQDCCCEIDVESISAAAEDITTPALNPLTDGLSPVNQFDVVELVVTVPTLGGSSCLAFNDLVVGLPGLDTTGGQWSLYDAGQVGGFAPVATVNGGSVSPVFSQGGSVGADGSGYQGYLDFSGIPIACGDVIEITFRMIAEVLNSDVTTMGTMSFTQSGAPCALEDVAVALPSFGVQAAGGGE